MNMIKYMQPVDYDFDFVVGKCVICASSHFEDGSEIYLSQIYWAWHGLF